MRDIKKQLKKARVVCREMVDAEDQYHHGAKAVIDMDRLKKGNPRPICISIRDAGLFAQFLGGNGYC